MSLRGSIGTLSEILRTYHVLDEKLKTIERDIIERDIKELASEFKEVRIEHIKLEGRVARLEEARETIKAEVRKELAEATHKHEMDFLRIQMDLKVAYTKAEAELKTTPPSQPSLPPSSPDSDSKPDNQG